MKAREKLHEVFRLPVAEAAARFGAPFVSYYQDYFSGCVNPDILFFRAKRLVDTSRAHGKSLLDCGCGDGIDAILMRACGAARVVGVDPASHKAPVQRGLLEFFGSDGVAFVHSLIEEYHPPEPFDAATAIASLSHVPDVDGVLSHLARLVKTDGVITVFEDNNIRRRGYMRRLTKLWEDAESGALASEGVPSYRSIREEYLREHVTGLTPEHFAVIHRDMRSLYGRRLLEAVQAFLAGKTFENPPPHVARNPRTGEALEYPFEPADLARRLKRLGFQPKVYHCITPPWKSGLRGLAKRALRGLVTIAPPLLPYLVPIYIVSGTRRE